MADKRHALWLVTPDHPMQETFPALRVRALAQYLDPQRFDVQFVAQDRIQSAAQLLNEKPTDAVPGRGLLQRIKRGFYGREFKWQLIESVGKTAKYLLDFFSDCRWLLHILPTIKRALAEHPSQARPIIFTTFSPLASPLAGYLIKKKFPEVFWALDLRDELGSNPYNPWLIRKFNAFFERRFFQRADFVTSVSQGLLDHFRALHPESRATFSLFRNGYSHERSDWPVVPAGEKLQLIYAGSLYGPRKIDPLLDALQGLPAELRSQFHLQLVGNIPEYLLHKYGGLRSLISFENQWMPYEKSIEKIHQSDVAILLLPPIDRPWCYPLKFFDYISVQKSILSLDTPAEEIHQSLREYQIGYSVNYDSVPEIRRGLEQIHQDWRNGRLRRPTPEFSRQFSRRAQVEKFQQNLLSKL